MEKQPCRGILPTLYNITEDQIEALMSKYRKEHPEDKRTDEELRPLAVNTLINKK